MASRWNATNLETEGVTLLASTQKRVHRIHKDHPMIAMFRANWQALGLLSNSTDTYPSPDGEYYHVAGDVFDGACATLRPLMLGYARLTIQNQTQMDP